MAILKTTLTQNLCINIYSTLIHKQKGTEQLQCASTTGHPHNEQYAAMKKEHTIGTSIDGMQRHRVEWEQPVSKACMLQIPSTRLFAKGKTEGVEHRPVVAQSWSSGSGGAKGKQGGFGWGLVNGTALAWDCGDGYTTPGVRRNTDYCVPQRVDFPGSEFTNNCQMGYWVKWCLWSFPSLNI